MFGVSPTNPVRIYVLFGILSLQFLLVLFLSMINVSSVHCL